MVGLHVAVPKGLNPLKLRSHQKMSDPNRNPWHYYRFAIICSSFLSSGIWTLIDRNQVVALNFDSRNYKSG